MNKTISLIAIVTGLVLTSCGSLQTISFEQLQAAVFLMQCGMWLW